MARTESSMMPLGTKAPDFVLPDVVTGTRFSLNEIADAKPLLVMFICNHCPYVKHVLNTIISMSMNYRGRISFVAISSNDVVAYPEDSPEKMRATASEYGFTFPYLFDESQEIAKAYGAVCTPDFFLFNRELKCVYRGRLDASTPGKGIISDGEDMRKAINALLAGGEIDPYQKPSIGCSMKWSAT